MHNAAGFNHANVVTQLINGKANHKTKKVNYKFHTFSPNLWCQQNEQCGWRRTASRRCTSSFYIFVSWNIVFDNFMGSLFLRNLQVLLNLPSTTFWGRAYRSGPSIDLKRSKRQPNDSWRLNRPVLLSRDSITLRNLKYWITRLFFMLSWRSKRLREGLCRVLNRL